MHIVHEHVIIGVETLIEIIWITRYDVLYRVLKFHILHDYQHLQALAAAIAGSNGKLCNILRICSIT